MAELGAGFLRFEVRGQAFALPMAQLAGIQQLGETAGSNGPAGDGSASQARVAPTDLGELFFGEPSERPDGFIVVVRAERALYVLRADRVRAGTHLPAEEQVALPPIIGALDGPFDGLFRDPDGWGLLINVERLGDLIRREYGGGRVEHLYEL